MARTVSLSGQNSTGLTELGHAAAAVFPPSGKGRVASCRAALYSVLAQAFSPPTEGLVNAVRGGALAEVVRAAIAGGPAPHRQTCDPHLATEMTEGPERPLSRDALLLDYTRLFATGLTCPHYETDYLAADSFRLSHLLAKITGFYRAFGLRVADAAMERPDYIAVELDFLNFLAGKEAYALGQSQAYRARLCRLAQRRFFAEHLGRWGRMFAHCVGEAAETTFYQAAQALLQQVLLAEARYLRLDLNDVEQGDRAASDDSMPHPSDGGNTCDACCRR